MGIFIGILVLLVWISPYWWIDKCSKENVELAFVGISAFFVFAIIGGGWQFGLGVIILSIHLIIAYFREFSDWGAGNVFPAGNRLVRGQATVLLQAAVIWTAIT